MTQKPHISVVIPVYNCAQCLKHLYQRIETSLKPITDRFEVLLIDDNSPDGAWAEIKSMGENNPRIKGISFSRNFGQHHAISAGLDHATGDWVVVMDCDLQDPPEEIPKLYQKAQEGYDVVYAISAFRSDKGWLANLLRKIYFRLYDLLAKNTFETTNLSFFMVSEKVKNTLVQFREQTRHISSLIRYVGFRITGVEVTHNERDRGSSSYTFGKRAELAYSGIIAYSSTLLKISFVLGFVCAFISLSYGTYLIVHKLLYHSILAGWTSLMTMVLFSTGIILIFLGIIGMYIEKMYSEVKNMPLYIIKEKLNT